MAEANYGEEDNHDAEYAEGETMDGPMEIAVDGGPEQALERNNEARSNNEEASTRPLLANNQTEAVFEAHNDLFVGERRSGFDAYTDFLGQNTAKSDDLN